MKNKIFLGLMLLIMTSCEFFPFLPCKFEDKITISKTTNFTNKLMLNGYYYDTVKISGYVNIYLFYKNGIFNNQNSYNYLEIENNNIELTVDTIDKGNWGLYLIKEDSLEIQQWMPSYSNCKRIVIEKGVIINDTCFKIDKWKFSDENEWKKDSSFFIFKQYSPKPDSTNSFFD